MASPAPSQETGTPPVSTPSQESGVEAVILPYPQNAIARRFFPPMSKATHPAILKAQAFASAVLPTIIMLMILLVFWRQAGKRFAGSGQSVDGFA